jgi:hypothetical protein
MLMDWMKSLLTLLFVELGLIKLFCCGICLFTASISLNKSLFHSPHTIKKCANSTG